MALVHINFLSKVLGMYRNMDVILPQGRNGIGQDGRERESWRGIPVLYLFHGATDDHTMWQRNTSIERYAVEKGLAVVMPSSDLGAYSDMVYGYDYFRFLGEELPEILKEFLPCLSTERQSTYVAGLSMGGYGALKMAVSYPERFSHAAFLSGMLFAESIFDKGKMLEEKGVPDYSKSIFGKRENIAGTVNDLVWALEKRIEENADMPKLLQICGKDDFLYEDNLKIYNRFGKRLDWTAKWPDGGHQWWFWDQQIQRVLEWFISVKGEG